MGCSKTHPETANPLKNGDAKPQVFTWHKKDGWVTEGEIVSPFPIETPLR